MPWPIMPWPIMPIIGQPPPAMPIMRPAWDWANERSTAITLIASASATVANDFFMALCYASNRYRARAPVHIRSLDIYSLKQAAAKIGKYLDSSPQHFETGLHAAKASASLDGANGYI